MTSDHLPGDQARPDAPVDVLEAGMRAAPHRAYALTCSVVLNERKPSDGHRIRRRQNCERVLNALVQAQATRARWPHPDQSPDTSSGTAACSDRRVSTARSCVRASPLTSMPHRRLPAVPVRVCPPRDRRPRRHVRDGCRAPTCCAACSPTTPPVLTAGHHACLRAWRGETTEPSPRSVRPDVAGGGIEIVNERQSGGQSEAVVRER